MIRTFLDSGVLLTAWKGKDRARALAVMEDTEREFVTGQLIRLELIPKAAYQKQTAEMRLYEAHFSRAKSEEALSAEEAADEYLLMGLRLSEGIDLERLAAIDGRTLDEARIASLVQDGLVARNGTRLAATPKGRLVLDRLIVELAS